MGEAGTQYNYDSLPYQTNKGWGPLVNVRDGPSKTFPVASAMIEYYRGRGRVKKVVAERYLSLDHDEDQAASAITRPPIF